MRIISITIFSFITIITSFATAAYGNREAKLNNEATIIIDEDNKVTIEQDDMMVPAPDGEYETQGGIKFEVEDGIKK